MLARSEDVRVGWTRWARAQRYERGFWRRLDADIEAGERDQLDWYAWRARQLERLLSSAGVARRDGRVVEIGSGPIGIVNFLDWGARCAIDPLEHFYRTRPGLVALRRPGVTYLDGAGERLPFEDGSCSLVIVDNVIDHTCAPSRILSEVFRVLRRDGHLYLSVNVHTPWGAVLHAALAASQIDRGHPHTFTSRRLRRLLAAGRFAAIAEWIGDAREARRADRRAGGPRSRVKGWTGLSEFTHAVVCGKRAS